MTDNEALASELLDIHNRMMFQWKTCGPQYAQAIIDELDDDTRRALIMAYLGSYATSS